MIGHPNRQTYGEGGLPEPVKVDWEDKPYATTADYPGEFDEVKVIPNPEEAQQARRVSIDQVQDEFLKAQGRQRLEEISDDGARLDTPENHRQKAIEKMTDELTKAIERGEKAKAWGASIGIEQGFISKLNQALDKLQDAADDIQRFHR